MRTTLVIAAGFLLTLAVFALVLSSLSNRGSGRGRAKGQQSGPSAHDRSDQDHGQTAGDSKPTDNQQAGIRTASTNAQATGDRGDQAKGNSAKDDAQPTGAQAGTGDGSETSSAEAVSPDPNLNAVLLNQFHWQKLKSPEPIPEAEKSSIRLTKRRVLEDHEGKPLFKAMLISDTVLMVDRATLSIWLTDGQGRARAKAQSELSLVAGLDTRSISTPIPDRLAGETIDAEARLKVHNTLSDPEQIVNIEAQAFGQGRQTVVRIKADPPTDHAYKRMVFHAIASAANNSFRRTWRIDYPDPAQTQKPIIFAVAISDAPDRSDLTWNIHGIAVE